MDYKKIKKYFSDKNHCNFLHTCREASYRNFKLFIRIHTHLSRLPFFERDNSFYLLLQFLCGTKH